MAEREHFTNSRVWAFGTGFGMVGLAFGAQVSGWTHWIGMGIAYGSGGVLMLAATAFITKSFYARHPELPVPGTTRSMPTALMAHDPIKELEELVRVRDGEIIAERRALEKCEQELIELRRLSLSKVQLETLQLSVDLLKFVRDLEPCPVLKYNKPEIDAMHPDQMRKLYLAKDPDFIEAMALYQREDLSITPEDFASGLTLRHQRLFPWGQRVAAKYRVQQFHVRTDEMCDRLAAEGIIENRATFTLTTYPDASAQIIGFASKFWQLAYQVGEKEMHV